MRKLALGLFTLLIIPSGCSQNNQTVNNSTHIPTEEGIQMASLESAGIDSALMVSLTNAIQSGQYPNIHSLLIARDNMLVYEKYFEGNDEQWGQDLGIVTFTKDSLHDVRSISKSVVSACIGIAIAQGKIKSVDQKISELFPEYPAVQEGEKSELTIKHLLTMSTGLRWNEDVPYNDPENSEIQMILSPDPIAFVLSQLGKRENIYCLFINADAGFDSGRCGRKFSSGRCQKNVIANVAHNKRRGEAITIFWTMNYIKIYSTF